MFAPDISPSTDDVAALADEEAAGVRIKALLLGKPLTRDEADNKVDCGSGAGVWIDRWAVTRPPVVAEEEKIEVDGMIVADPAVVIDFAAVILSSAVRCSTEGKVALNGLD